MNELDRLLARIKQVPAQSVTYRGLAIGKDESRLHLAVPTGVIAIPVSAIVDVKAIGPGGEESDVVQVEVSDSSGVAHIRKVTPFEGEGRLGSRTKAVSAAPPEAYTWTHSHTETATITAGAPDATDDGFDGFEADEDVVVAPPDTGIDI